MMFLFSLQYSLLNDKLPENINILTLERWRKNEILLRLENIFEGNETSKYEQPAKIYIKVSIYCMYINLLCM